MAESSRHIPTLGIISNNVDVTEGSSSPLKVSPRSMESGDDTGDDMSVSYPSPSMTTSGKPSPTRIKIVKHRKVIVKRQKKQSQQSPSSHFDRSVTEAGETTVDNQTCDNDPSNTDNDEEIVAIPKPGCRYGAGCTHIADPAHRMKFWHPVVQELTGKLLSCFMFSPAHATTISQRMKYNRTSFVMNVDLQLSPSKIFKFI